MQNKNSDPMDTSYRNPFDDYNANVLDPELLMQYWCTPFQTDALKGLNEHGFFTQKMPIILQGSRGSGKTTILKYFSFPVQCQRANIAKVNIIEQIIKDQGVGFYFRCDNSFVQEFQAVFSRKYKENWIQCFEHYFELLFSNSLIHFISRIEEQSDLKISLSGIDSFAEQLQLTSIDKLHDYIDSEIRYISTFKNEALFTNIQFQPRNVWHLYDISGRLIQSIKKSAPSLAGIRYLLLIDEFENLTSELQALFNTFIKFCRPDVSMRIGRRSENSISAKTINNVEYLREMHDYQLVVLDQWSDQHLLREYLWSIAQKRLEVFTGVTIPSDLIQIIGDNENLDDECQRIAGGRNNHLITILSGNDRLSHDNDTTERIIAIISYPENRIAEMLCALWVARCDDSEDLVSAAINYKEAMLAAFSQKDHPLKKKFLDQYNNKYRYALTVFLYSVYRKDKSYYGFNDLCYLSDGNARVFINLCKAIISDALFYEHDRFVSTQKISITSQSRAIRNYAISEFNSVFSIIQNGKEIRELVLSIGNVFQEYHKDKYVRYPETNQFVFSYEVLDRHTQDVINTALSWAIIKKRNTPQRLSASISKDGDIYTLNRIFAPVFNISYRTRGGVNVQFSTEELQQMISGQFSKSKLSATNKKRRANTSKRVEITPDMNQLSLFDQTGGED